MSPLAAAENSIGKIFATPTIVKKI